MKTSKRIYRLHGITPLLGSAPASASIRTEYIASKAPTDELRQEEADELFSIETTGLTVFRRDKLDRLCLMGYMIKGFFKEAMQALQGQTKIVGYKSKIDTLIFVEPRYIPICREGKPLTDEDEVLERPLRAMTPQGPRSALQASEQIDDPWEVTIELTLLPNAATAKGAALSWQTVEEALDYGAYHGVGQWRNADYGRFIWERLEDEEETEGAKEAE